MRYIIQYCIKSVPTDTILYKSCIQWLKAFFFYLHMEEDTLADKLSPVILEHLIKDPDVLWWSDSRRMLIKDLLQRRILASNSNMNRNVNKGGDDDAAAAANMEGCLSPIISTDINCENQPDPYFATLQKLKNFLDTGQTKDESNGRAVFFLDRQYYTVESNEEKPQNTHANRNQPGTKKWKSEKCSLMTTIHMKGVHCSNNELCSIYLMRGENHKTQEKELWLALAIRDKPRKRPKHSKESSMTPGNRLYHLYITVYALGNTQTFTSNQSGAITTNYTRLDLKNSIPKEWSSNCFTFAEDNHNTSGESTLLSCENGLLNGEGTGSENGYYARCIMPFVIRIKIEKSEKVV